MGEMHVTCGRLYDNLEAAMVLDETGQSWSRSPHILELYSWEGPRIWDGGKDLGGGLENYTRSLGECSP